MIIEIIVFIELMLLIFMSIFGMVFCDERKHRIGFLFATVMLFIILGKGAWDSWFN